MTKESLCYNVGADRVASTVTNKNFVRSIDDRASEGKRWWETYRVALRVATIEASIRKNTEAVLHKGSNFDKLVTSREDGVKRKLDEAILSTSQQHRIFICSSGWLRCYDCLDRAKPDNKEYWRGKKCSRMLKRHCKGPTAEHFALWQYCLSEPVEYFDYASQDEEIETSLPPPRRSKSTTAPRNTSIF